MIVDVAFTNCVVTIFVLECSFLMYLSKSVSCPSSPVVFSVPHASFMPFSSHSPEVLRLSFLFPSPDCPTYLLTCLHFPHQPHSRYAGPLPLFQCQFIVLSCTQLCSCVTSACHCLPLPVCLLPAPAANCLLLSKASLKLKY